MSIMRNILPAIGGKAHKPAFYKPYVGSADSAGTPSPVRPAAEKDISLRPYIVGGVVIVVLAFGGFFGWSLLASLDKAAIAPGQVVTDSNRKPLQHYEGGIMRELLVKEGEYVKEGQLLMRLDPLRSKATLTDLQGKRLSANAQIARLQAEQDDRESLEFPQELTARGEQNPAVKDMLNAEQALFKARRAAHLGSIRENEKRIEQIKHQISAYQSQIASSERIARITGEELQAAETLLNKGYERLPRVQELRRRQAELQGTIGELNARIAQSREAIAQFESAITNLTSTRQTEVSDNLQQLLAEASTMDAQVDAAEDMLRRTDLIAPQDGRIVSIRIFTPGGVVKPGEEIMDLVPVDDTMVVSARVKPVDIDTVRPGLPANVHLLAYRQRRTPPAKGVVEKVSPDRLVDERTGEPYYKAKVLLEAKDLPPGVELYPGMPVDVFINTGSRRALDYFISPITDSWERAFREE